MQENVAILSQQWKLYLDKTTIWVKTRWLVSSVLFLVFVLRVTIAQGWFVSAYALAIHLLNLFIGFVTPQKDPETEAYILPIKSSTYDEYRPFLRKVSEFAFWQQGTLAILVALGTTCFRIFDLPVFWPVLVVYFIVLFVFTMKHQIRDMIQHQYIPLSIGKKKYGDPSTDPVKRINEDRRDD